MPSDQEILEQHGAPHDRLYSILMKQDEITWQTVIQDLVKSEEMDAWDINITLLTQKYIEAIKTLKEHDFRVSGKMLLAAALLLKIKSSRLVGEDIEYLDRLMKAEDDADEELLDFEEQLVARDAEDIPKNLIPRTPMPRKRKVSIDDLMGALERALEVKRRRVLKSVPPVNVKVPEKKKDVSVIITEIFGKIKNYFWEQKAAKVTFSQLIPSNDRDGKIYAFLPLLYLTNQRKVNIFQEQHFGEISVHLNEAEGKVAEELATKGL